MIFYLKIIVFNTSATEMIIEFLIHWGKSNDKDWTKIVLCLLSHLEPLILYWLKNNHSIFDTKIL